MNHGLILRYYLLMEKLRQGTHPGLDEVLSYLGEHDLSVSKRTLQRDIEALRHDFGIEVVFDADRQGYRIEEEMSTDPERFFRFLEVAGTAQLLSESLEENKKSLQYFDFESTGDMRGTWQLKDLLFAIRNRREVEFQHESYSHGSEKDYCVQPYMLKEYQHRWYLVGLVPSIASDDPVESSRTFGLDRIHSLRITDRLFDPHPDYNPQRLFDQTVGLVYSEGELQEVELWADALQTKYLRSLPLHHTQEPISEDEAGTRFRYHLIPNYEFIQKVMMMGDRVKLMRPQWLAEDIEKRLERALGLYR